MVPARRRLVVTIAAIVVAAVCVRLGIWQLHRLEERRARNAAVVAGTASTPIPLGTALDEGTPDGLAFRHVTATGTYDPAHEVILYGRTLDDRPGNHVLTPLDVGDGAAVLVDRGWIPFEADQAVPVTGAAAAPDGVVTVDGYLLPAEDATSPGAAPVRTIQRIDIELLQGQIPERLAPMAIQLASQDPSQASPVPAPLPELDEGPHLSYAIQWFSFATIALVGGAVLLLRDRRRSEPGVARSTPDGASSAPEGR